MSCSLQLWGLMMHIFIKLFVQACCELDIFYRISLTVHLMVKHHYDLVSVQIF